MILSKIISTLVQKGMLIIKILGFGDADIKTVYNILPFGIDSNPTKEYRGIYADTGVNGEKILIGVINKNVLTDVGETRIFSENTSGVEQFIIHLKSDNTCEIGGDSDFMVRYSALESSFDELKDDFNSLVQIFNAHVHPGVLSGGASTLITTTISTESSADISGAKIDNIKTN